MEFYEINKEDILFVFAMVVIIPLELAALDFCSKLLIEVILRPSLHLVILVCDKL